jgi:hypothetical protein
MNMTFTYGSRTKKCVFNTSQEIVMSLSPYKIHIAIQIAETNERDWKLRASISQRKNKQRALKLFIAA